MNTYLTNGEIYNFMGNKPNGNPVVVRFLRWNLMVVRAYGAGSTVILEVEPFLKVLFVIAVFVGVWFEIAVTLITLLVKHVLSR